jgi:7-cyano-7-deazaguanine reductase
LWRCYEVSTQLTNGMPVYTILTIAYPATSKYLVESKSLKLYLNSFNLECMGDDKQRAIAALRVKVAEDLIKLLETQVEVTEGYSYSFQKFEDYTSLEEIVDYSKIKAEKVVSSGILQRSNLRIAKRTKVRFDGFRSNCKITNAPDYATVFIKVIGNEGVDAESLVKYLTAYRADQHLHEECAELIFSDLKNVFNPKELLVSCCYTRRGGIDITPTRYYREYVSEYMRSMQWPPHVEPEYYPERTVYQ